jgi:hypothetical protein
MTRRFWLRCFAWTFGLFGWHCWLAQQCPGDEQQATLNELLRSKLKCRRPQEFAYINLVTQKVDAGVLPVALVLSMMKWAMKRAAEEKEAGRRTTDIPFPYFQEGLHRRAAEIGVDLPPFNG